jgi:hypothetical protein
MNSSEMNSPDVGYNGQVRRAEHIIQKHWVILIY